MPVKWTAERDEKLKLLMDGGVSMPQAAKILETTRNAIIGRLHRLKIRSSFAHAVPNHSNRKSRIKKPGTAPVTVPIPTSVDSLWVSLMDLSFDGCKWIKGDKPFFYCGVPREGHRDYCPYHCTIAFRPDTRPFKARSLRY
jgi:GcrA cell cycle regulator